MKKPLALLALLVVALAAACASAPQEKKGEEFRPFFQRFMEDKPFSLDRTRFPLISVIHENGAGAGGRKTPKAVTETLPKEEVAKQPTLSEYMKTTGMNWKEGEQTQLLAKVVVFKPDTDWQLEFTFQLFDGAWKLVEVHDWSL